MGRRADHTREELRSLIVEAGEALMSEVGLTGFSAREVAKRIGYSVGSIYNVFANSDELILAINAGTLDAWAEFMRAALARGRGPRLHRLAIAYFDFAETNRHRWAALFAHRLPSESELPPWYRTRLRALFALVEVELSAELGSERLSRKASQTLFAAIHGLCVLSFDGTLATIGGGDPRRMATSFIDDYLRGFAGRNGGRNGV